VLRVRLSEAEQLLRGWVSNRRAGTAASHSAAEVGVGFPGIGGRTGGRRRGLSAPAMGYRSEEAKGLGAVRAGLALTPTEGARRHRGATTAAAGVRVAWRCCSRVPGAAIRAHHLGVRTIAKHTAEKFDLDIAAFQLL
jgi:hypothetical protein